MDTGFALLDEAEQHVTAAQRPVLHAQRALLLKRSGRYDLALAAVRPGGRPAHRAGQPAGPGQGAQQPQPGAPGDRQYPAGPGRPAPLRARSRPATAWPCTSRSARSTSAAWTWWPVTCPRRWPRSPPPGPTTSGWPRAGWPASRSSGPAGCWPPGCSARPTGNWRTPPSRPPRSSSATPRRTPRRSGPRLRCWPGSRTPPRSGPRTRPAGSVSAATPGAPRSPR